MLNEHELYLPDYQKSIVNLLSRFLKHFGCHSNHPEFPLEGSFEGFFNGVNKIVIFLVDGMGYNKFIQVNEKLGFESILKVSSVFPSTTAAAVTSWFTGKTPKEHGLLGYILYLREIGGLANMIEFTYPGIEGNIFSSILKKRLHRIDNIFDQLKEKGLYGGVITHASIANSGLSYLIHKNGHIMGYYYMGDLLATLRKKLLEDWSGILYVYWGHLDGLGHKKGPDSDAYDMEMTRILMELKRFTSESLPHDSLFVITSDHGMIQIPNSSNNFLKPTDSFNRLLSSPPGGEMRMMYFYLLKRSAYDALRLYFDENYPNSAIFLSNKEALEMELFGPGRTHPELYNRIGDAIMIATKNNAFTYMYSGGEERLAGMHGGLTEEELYVPAVFLRR
ncbi:phosphodiesterase [Fervidobacterium riparium]|uniref:Predicted pyrophosphatase or phosphodiesterase, AlkP superfamily n=1 Tax=Fervidobacterium gondwanense DSM 13020 TaxID=1121883 RepID=A0A1M7TCF0_FERGO|nr:phosphodiesterase [Fervidobacterium riparium]SHN68373.1 Predicted pyrophosphatase or phosphodiesterase, AlkP superfamily [Fervidobacterium gondwanense DSM 13020]